MKNKIIWFLIFIILVLLGLLAVKTQKADTDITTNDQLAENNPPVEETCPYYVSSEDFPGESIPYANSVNVLYPPKPITSTIPIEIIYEKFDPKNSYYEDRDLFVQSGEKPWHEWEMDVDKDGKEERILLADIAMNHTPHIALIVKDGYVIFKANGAQTYISQVDENNGFLLHQTLDWNTGEEIITRYLYKDGKFVPAWEQKICNVRVKD